MTRFANGQTQGQRRTKKDNYHKENSRQRFTAATQPFNTRSSEVARLQVTEKTSCVTYRWLLNCKLQIGFGARLWSIQSKVRFSFCSVSRYLFSYDGELIH